VVCSTQAVLNIWHTVKREAPHFPLLWLGLGGGQYFHLLFPALVAQLGEGDKDGQLKGSWPYTTGLLQRPYSFFEEIQEYWHLDRYPG